MSNSKIIVPIEPTFKALVERLAKDEGKSASDVVRSLLVEYVRHRDMSWYIDDLWKRTGDQLRARGVGVRDVRRAIREVRDAKKRKSPQST